MEEVCIYLNINNYCQIFKYVFAKDNQFSPTRTLVPAHFIHLKLETDLY